eukprot:TRINITY_DN33009_c0_g1_i1.p1 TRINITY_DN33009_c0_g1~~TRINITY_DN33009_c0_g1_i1.p1  ORF type:complete len:252 (+),score=35.08 TRINITY_DN33009_c0_g1_i1:51-806(+)
MESKPGLSDLKSYESARKESEKIQAKIDDLRTEWEGNPPHKKRLTEEIKNQYSRLSESKYQEEKSLLNANKKVEEYLRQQRIRQENQKAGKIYLYPDERDAEALSPGVKVAAQVSQGAEGGFWILCTVVRHLSERDKYLVEDVDVGSDPTTDGDTAKTKVPKIYTLSPKNVVRLPTPEDPKCYSVSTKVLAIFPNTTAFYPATIVKSFSPESSQKHWQYILEFDGDEREADGNPTRRSINYAHVVVAENGT